MSDTDPADITLGEYLRIARVEKGLSIRELARRVEVNHAYLARIENGERGDPKPELLQRLAAELDVDPAELLAYLGVKPHLPEPRMYFRAAYNLTSAEADVVAEEVAKLLAEFHEKNSKRKEGRDENTNH